MGLLSSYTAAIAGILGPKFIGPLMQGYALSYVVVLPVRLLSLLVLPRKDQEFDATILYFAVNIAILTSMAISIPVSFKSSINNRLDILQDEIHSRAYSKGIYDDQRSTGDAFIE